MREFCRRTIMPWFTGEPGFIEDRKLRGEEMDSYRLGIKFFVADGSNVSVETFIPVFHSWIQRRAIEDHLLIDVADYKHVPHGPGAVLIAHEANYSMDEEDGRLGLLYVRKQPGGASFGERIRQCFTAGLQACDVMENEEQFAGRIRFKTDEAVFRIYDRLLAPNTGQTFAAVEAELKGVVADLYHTATVELKHVESAERVFEVRIKTGSSLGVRALLDRAAIPR